MKVKLFSIAAALSFLFFLSAAPAFAQQLPTTCSNAMLHGNYAFTINGKIMPPGQTAFVAQQGVAMTNYDGNGNLTQVDFIMTNGVPSLNPSTAVNGNGFRENETGTYTVNPDCTGSLTINFKTKFDTPAATIQVKFVLAKSGREIREVVQSVTAFLPGGPDGGVNVPATILADGKKLEPPNDNQD
jgi:hypothetical protein